MTADALLTQYILWMFAFAFGVLAIVALLTIWIDKNFAIALIFAEGALLVITATWGKQLVFDAFLRVSSVELIMRSSAPADNTGFAVLALAISGVLAVLMMQIRASFELKKKELERRP